MVFPVWAVFRWPTVPDVVTSAPVGVQHWWHEEQCVMLAWYDFEWIKPPHMATREKGRAITLTERSDLFNMKDERPMERLLSVSRLNPGKQSNQTGKV